MTDHLPPALILAGGLGTRLGDEADGRPKPIVDVHGRPFLHYVLRLLRSQGVRSVTVSVGHRGQEIQDVVGAGADHGLAISYLDDGPSPLGTGGAVRLAAEHLPSPFLVVNGDCYLPCDHAAAVATFRASGRPALMVVHRNAGRWDRSNVRFEDGAVLAYDKWNPSADMDCIDYGLGVFTREAVADLPLGDPADLGHVVQQLIRRDALAGHEVAERFYEVGSPSGLAEFRALAATWPHG